MPSVWTPPSISRESGVVPAASSLRVTRAPLGSEVISIRPLTRVIRSVRSWTAPRSAFTVCDAGT